MLAQGTVTAWETSTRSGRVVLDGGQALDLPPGALTPRTRLLRRGQRVLVELAGTDAAAVGAGTTIAAVQLLTVPPRT